MTNEPSPRPWHTANFINGIEDANNGKVAANLRGEDAELIVKAVNGRAALSAVLRDMAKDCEAAWEGTPLRRALAKYFARLREIAGEGETPKGKGVGR